MAEIDRLTIRIPRTIEEHEQFLLDQLRDLHLRYRTEAEPIIAALVKIDSLKPPRQVILEKLAQEFHASEIAAMVEAARRG